MRKRERRKEPGEREEVANYCKSLFFVVLYFHECCDPLINTKILAQELVKIILYII